MKTPRIQNCNRLAPKPLSSVILSRTHLIELLAETKNFNKMLRKWKAMKYAYKLSDDRYLFSWLACVPKEDRAPIDFASIEAEALELRKQLKDARKKKHFNS